MGTAKRYRERLSGDQRERGRGREKEGERESAWACNESEGCERERMWECVREARKVKSKERESLFLLIQRNSSHQTEPDLNTSSLIFSPNWSFFLFRVSKTYGWTFKRLLHKRGRKRRRKEKKVSSGIVSISERYFFSTRERRKSSNWEISVFDRSVKSDVGVHCWMSIEVRYGHFSGGQTGLSSWGRPVERKDKLIKHITRRHAVLIIASNGAGQQRFVFTDLLLIGSSFSSD